jgi:iron complex outermembrane receptor protein
MSITRRGFYMGSFSLLACLASQNALAQTAPADLNAPSYELKTIIIKGKAFTALSRPDVTASRLQLPPKETPASLSAVTQAAMQQRGYAQVEDAVDSTPGASSGGSPGDPTGFSMRGFTGDEVTVLRDGIYYGPSDMVNRPENSFNLKDVEVLRGPASELFGQGSVGGIVNVLTKQPNFGPTTYDADLTYGSFNTINAGIGLGTTLNDRTAVRLDISRTASSGYVHNDNPNDLDVTGSVLVLLTSNLQLNVGMEYLHSRLPSYYGTPLVPEADALNSLGGVVKSTQGLTIDEPMRYNNYNVSNPELLSNTYIPQATLTWEPASNIVVSNEVYYYYAGRRWQNAETYTYIGPNAGATDAAGNVIPAGSVARDRFYVYHSQHQEGDDLHVNVHDTIFGLQNQYTIGGNAYHIDFVRDRGFPDAQYADYVNAYDVNQGSFGDFPGDFPIKQAPTHISDAGIYAEDVLNLTSALKLVVGGRYDWFYLVRDNFNQNGAYNANSSFRITFHPNNYRAALVYDINPDVTVYGGYTTAQDPPGSNIFLANKGQVQGLSGAQQEEVGAKATLLDGTADGTIALYNIARNNILTTTSSDVVADIGSERAQGVEVSADWAPVKHLSLQTNAAYTHAWYGTFVDPNTGLNADGNKPPNVPTVTANAWAYYTDAFNQPLDLGLGARFVGARAGDYGNTLTLQPYTLINLSLTYHVTPHVDVTGRVDNLLDKAYASWADVNYPSEVLLGAPRAFYLELHVHG